MKHRIAAALAALAVVLVSLALSAAPSTPIKARLDDATNATQVLTFSGEGREFVEVMVEITGPGTSVAYSLTTRICTATATCSAWETTPIASGTLAGDVTAQTVTIGPLTAPHDQYQLTLTVTGSPSSLRAWAVKH